MASTGSYTLRKVSLETSRVPCVTMRVATAVYPSRPALGRQSSPLSRLVSGRSTLVRGCSSVRTSYCEVPHRRTVMRLPVENASITTPVFCWFLKLVAWAAETSRATGNAGSSTPREVRWSSVKPASYAALKNAVATPSAPVLPE